MPQCGLAAFHLTQLGLMGTFRYFLFLFLFYFNFCILLFCLFFVFVYFFLSFVLSYTNRNFPVHANEGLYPKRTPFAGALKAFVRFGSPYAHRTRSKRICCFVRR